MLVYHFKWLKALTLLLVALLAAGWAVYQSEWFQRNFIYPFPNQQMVFHYSLINEIDPYLIAAVIRTESKFISDARSPKGAIGLMQIMPDTGQWVAGQLHVVNYSVDSLLDPDANVRLGTWYLASLYREFNANEILMLAAYNGGRGNVKQWMRQLNWDANFRDIEQIPFQETREYVKKVLRAKEKYHELYAR